MPVSTVFAQPSTKTIVRQTLEERVRLEGRIATRLLRAQSLVWIELQQLLHQILCQ